MARKQHGHDIAHCRARFLTQHRIVIVGDRMADDCERIAFQTVHIAHGFCGARETIGDDRDRRYAEPLGLDRVVQTARRAAPSIANRGENGVRSAHLRQHSRRRRS